MSVCYNTGGDGDGESGGEDGVRVVTETYCHCFYYYCDFDCGYYDDCCYCDCYY